MTARAFRLPPGWGVAALGPAGIRPGRSLLASRSYDHLGAMLIWRPGPASDGARAVACDLEHESRFAAPVRVAGCGGATISIEAWVATEVLAKLTREPVLSFLQAHGPATVGAGVIARVDLLRFGEDGKARIFLSRNGDGCIAAFGIREG